MQIKLLPYERRSLEVLEQKFALEREIVDGFALSLNILRRLYEQVAIGFKGKFKAGRVVMMGLINHTHHLLAGGLQALEAGNGAVWSACVRGLMETVGACVLISEQPAKAPNFLQEVKSGKLRSAAGREDPGLTGDIKRLDQIVHPVSGAIYAGFKIVDTKERTTQIRFGLCLPTSHEGREGVIVLANLAALLEQKFAELVSREEVLSAGKLIMISTI